MWGAEGGVVGSEADELLAHWATGGNSCDLVVEEVVAEDERRMGSNLEEECHTQFHREDDEEEEVGGVANGWAEEDDLYGDLDVAVFSSPKKSKSLPRDVLENRLEEAVKEILELKERITNLSRENLNLLSNFSSLLRTAREDKEKNIFTLRELRNQLRHVTTQNVERSSLSKEEVANIFAYCNQVESQLQSQISLDVIRGALDSAKSQKKKEEYKRKWSKQLKFGNMSMYICKEQINFSRLEQVTFPAKQSQNESENKSDKEVDWKTPSSEKVDDVGRRKVSVNKGEGDRVNKKVQISDRAEEPDVPRNCSRSSTTMSNRRSQEITDNNGRSKSREFRDHRNISKERHSHNHNNYGTSLPSNSKSNRISNSECDGNDRRSGSSHSHRSRSPRSPAPTSRNRSSTTSRNSLKRSGVDKLKASNSVNSVGNSRSSRSDTSARNTKISSRSKTRSTSPVQRRGGRQRTRTSYRHY